MVYIPVYTKPLRSEKNTGAHIVLIPVRYDSFDSHADLKGTSLDPLVPLHGTVLQPVVPW